MQQESTENWIDHMINKAFENYNGREIVIWGRYGVSDSIKDGLREKYGIDTAFYVDSDISKINGRTVLSPEYLFGKSDKYFINNSNSILSVCQRCNYRGGGIVRD